MAATVARVVVIVFALAAAAWLTVAARSFSAQDRIATLALENENPNVRFKPAEDACKHIWSGSVKVIDGGGVKK